MGGTGGVKWALQALTVVLDPQWQSPVVTVLWRVCFVGFRGTPVVFSSTKLIHEFGVHLRAVQRDVPCAPAVGRCVGP